MNALQVSTFVVLAGAGSPTTDESTGIGPGGPGFWVVVAMIVAGIVLWRSMRRHVGGINIPEDPDAPPRPKTRPEIGDE